jgi:two-component system, LuxR family, response regulator FixJ
MSARTVRVVDDDEAVRDSMRALLEACGLTVRDYASAVEFLADCPETCRDCVLLDIHMPGMTGLELLEILHNRGAMPPVIAITGRADAVLRSRAHDAGAIAVFDKPLDEDLLLGAIEAAWQRQPQAPSTERSPHLRIFP